MKQKKVNINQYNKIMNKEIKKIKNLPIGDGLINLLEAASKLAIVSPRVKK